MQFAFDSVYTFVKFCNNSYATFSNGNNHVVVVFFFAELGERVPALCFPAFGRRLCPLGHFVPSANRFKTT